MWIHDIYIHTCCCYMALILHLYVKCLVYIYRCGRLSNYVTKQVSNYFYKQIKAMALLCRAVHTLIWPQSAQPPLVVVWVLNWLPNLQASDWYRVYLVLSVYATAHTASFSLSKFNFQDSTKAQNCA